MEKFGEKLRAVRKQRGLSLQQLGDELGVSKTYIWEMENGKKVPNIAMLIKICDVFTISADKLIRDEFGLD